MNFSLQLNKFIKHFHGNTDTNIILIGPCNDSGACRIPQSTHTSIKKILRRHIRQHWNLGTRSGYTSFLMIAILYIVLRRCIILLERTTISRKERFVSNLDQNYDRMIQYQIYYVKLLLDLYVTLSKHVEVYAKPILVRFGIGEI